MEIIFVWAFFLIVEVVFMSGLIYYVIYPQYDKHITLAIDLLNDLDCDMILDFGIKVEEEIQNVELDKL
jgi:hypothetical protein